MKTFLDTHALRNTWSDFASQKNIATKPKNFQHGEGKPTQQQYQPPQQQHQNNSNSAFILPSQRHNVDPLLFKDDICVLWNLGKCLKPPGGCNTRFGKQLRHVCNHRPDPSKPDIHPLRQGAHGHWPGCSTSSNINVFCS